jgi:hypothetical protein
VRQQLFSIAFIQRLRRLACALTRSWASTGMYSPSSGSDVIETGAAGSTMRGDPESRDVW